MMPFEALYGRPPSTIDRYIKEQLVRPWWRNTCSIEMSFLLASSRISRRPRLGWKLLQTNWRDLVFNDGDWVFVKLQPFRQNLVRLQRHHKLGQLFFGPVKIVSRVGEVAYKLDLPTSARIHLVFHISVLHKCNEIPDQQVTPLHLVNQHRNLTLAAILNKCVIERAGH